MQRFAIFTMLVVSVVGLALASEARPKESLVERGRYVAKVAGCNDCHTPGYADKAGNAPEKDWLIGDAVGWNGPWGTTYSPNLRTRLAAMTEDEWVSFARVMKSRPPMPWFNVNAMAEEDLRAFYQFVRSLGPNPNVVPAFLPPGTEPPKPYFTLVVPSKS